VRVELGGVPETLLWTLYHRAVEARRPDAVLNDPMGVALVDRIDYPFAERFGAGDGLGQWQALRARRFDLEVRRFVAAHPGGTVVALGEGLETQFWRVDDGRVRWLTVDLPETVAVRDELLPPEGRRRTLACSALDERWMDEVDPARGVLVTAQGLFMYLAPEEVHGLVAACARRFGGASLVFDAVPGWLAARSRAGAGAGRPGAGNYQAPPWDWALDGAEERRLRALPGVADLATLRLPRGRGAVHGALLPLAGAVPGVRRLLLSVLRARFR
jgi:O-methyltransferase involved in polyketide biosynthesis